MATGAPGTPTRQRSRCSRRRAGPPGASRRSASQFIDGRREWHQDEQETLAAIIEHRRAGLSWAKVADKLNATGHRTRTGGQWTRQGAHQVRRSQEQGGPRDGPGPSAAGQARVRHGGVVAPQGVDHNHGRALRAAQVCTAVPLGVGLHFFFPCASQGSIFNHFMRARSS